ncbi:hypothetical protein BHE74_00043461 [Ensete ventricosum]|nr:hypothetical protein GW17_00009177 [Ensete ventricosum]RWW50298.1 hypothetical protein BHE74_00043461 [Ensete ventricosum]
MIPKRLVYVPNFMLKRDVNLQGRIFWPLLLINLSVFQLLSHLLLEHFQVADYICIFITSYAMELLRFREAGIEVVVKASFLLPDVLYLKAVMLLHFN